MLPLRLAFPNYSHAPVKFRKLFVGSGVSFNIRCELVCPILCPALRHSGLRAAFVAVPKTSVHEHGDPMLREDEVRFSRQILAMKPKTQTHFVGRSAYALFRRCMLAPNPRHQPGTAFGSETVDHGYAALSSRPRSMASATMASISRAMIGETLFPIILKLCQIVSWN